MTVTSRHLLQDIYFRTVTSGQLLQDNFLLFEYFGILNTNTFLLNSKAQNGKCIRKRLNLAK